MVQIIYICKKCKIRNKRKYENRKNDKKDNSDIYRKDVVIYIRKI